MGYGNEVDESRLNLLEMEKVREKMVESVWRLLPKGLLLLHYFRYLTSGGSKLNQHLVPSDRLDEVEQGSFAEEGHVDEGGQGESFGVTSWNICYGLYLGRVTRFLRHNPHCDVILLQEVDWMTRRAKFRNVARFLAEKLSMHYAFGIEFLELAQSRDHQPAFHGQAILSRFPIHRTRMLRFQTQPMDWSREAVQPRRGGRMALTAEIKVGPRTLTVYNTHLESRFGDEGRALQMREILSDIEAQRGSDPILIAGDLNTRFLPSPVIQEAQKYQFLDALHGVAMPRNTGGGKCLDWILSRGLEPISPTIHSDIWASDHKPLSVRLRIP